MISKIVPRPGMLIEKSNPLLFKTRLYLDPNEIQVIRNVYDVNTLLSDLGGVVRVLMTIFGVLLYPLSQNQFYFEAARRIYLARTKDEKLF